MATDQTPYSVVRCKNCGSRVLDSEEALLQIIFKEDIKAWCPKCGWITGPPENPPVIWAKSKR